jgi:hypothetical protein
MGKWGPSNITNQYFFEPNGGDGPRFLTRFLDIARESEHLAICTAYFNHKEIANAVAERANRNQETWMIISKSALLDQKSSKTIIKICDALDCLIEAISTTEVSENPPKIHLAMMRDDKDRRKTKYSMMHHKFFFTSHLLGRGSANFTYNGLSNSYEDMQVTTWKHDVIEFKDRFLTLWEKCEVMAVSDGKMKGIQCTQCENDKIINFTKGRSNCPECGRRFEVVYRNGFFE